MKQFCYLQPASLEEALELLVKYRSERLRVIAGGTDLLTALRAGALTIDYLLDLAGLGLDAIVEIDGEVRIGALATFKSLLQNKLIQAKLPVLIAAAERIGAVQTRNLATIGGNLCSAIPSLDSAPSVMVLGARLRLITSGAERLVPVEKFFLGPRRTVLQPGEILAEIIVPVPGKDFGASFLKFGRRKALTLAVVNVAAGLRLKAEQEIVEARVVLGAVAPTPIRARKAEAKLLGQKASPELFMQAAAVAAGETAPISDLRASAAYRLHLSEVLVKRALNSAWQQVTGEVGRESA
ncbi:MAG: xanthine dehydrogenase family protein subunit M [Firmicutes bacterium]|nr:xanthine dehydrogenase family protein subunit M [Bacillota bacterium]